MRIAIVGAGSAGMAMAKQIIELGGGLIHFVLFERRSEVGGIWQYDATPSEGHLAWEDEQANLHHILPHTSIEGADNRNVEQRSARRLRFAWTSAWQPGPMFDGLRTNIASDLMTYRDAPFRSGTDLFPDRATVQEYLEDYATKNNLRQYVRFGSSVTSIQKLSQDESWTVKSRAVMEKDSKKESTETFSHVVLAHGRCSTPNIPNIPGLETFEGRIIHSAWYRDPASIFLPKESRRVLVVGNASSGMDISRELSGFSVRNLPSGMTPNQWAQHCKHNPISVYQSWHSLDKAPPMDYNPLDPDSPDWCRSIQVVPSISSICGPQVYLENGEIIEDVPLIIFATGFLMDSPFIDQSSGILQSYPLLPPSASATSQGFPSSTVYNLDDWLLLHRKDETLAYLGLPTGTVPFPMTLIQSRYVINRWLGRVDQLPLLDENIPVNDAERWKSRRSSNDEPSEKNGECEIHLRTTSQVFGSSSEFAYIDALLTFVHKAEQETGISPPWMEDYMSRSDGLGNGRPREPEHFYNPIPWRSERRTNGKLLRRVALGY